MIEPANLMPQISEKAKLLRQLDKVTAHALKDLRKLGKSHGWTTHVHIQTEGGCRAIFIAYDKVGRTRYFDTASLPDRQMAAKLKKLFTIWALSEALPACSE